MHCTSANGFRVTRAALDDAYRRAQKQRLRVKGVLITNPSNPLGTTSPRADLEMLIDFVAAKGIHLVSDEIYSGTAFAEPGFVSVLEVVAARRRISTDADGLLSERVHVVYSLSKDLGLRRRLVGRSDLGLRPLIWRGSLRSLRWPACLASVWAPAWSGWGAGRLGSFGAAAKASALPPRLRWSSAWRRTATAAGSPRALPASW